MMKIHPIKCEMEMISKNICNMKICLWFFFVLHDYYVRIFWKWNDVENLAQSLVLTLFHANIYSKMSSSYMGNLGYIFARLRFLSLIIMKVQN